MNTRDTKKTENPLVDYSLQTVRVLLASPKNKGSAILIPSFNGIFRLATTRKLEKKKC